MKKVLDPAKATGLCSDALDQPPRALINALLRHLRTRRAGQQRLRDSLVGRRIGHAEQMFRSVSHNERSGAWTAGILPARMPRALGKS